MEGIIFRTFLPTMIQTLRAGDLTLNQVKEQFGLREAPELSFFLEWQKNLPELNPDEMRSLDQLKTNFLYLLEFPMSEEAVKLVVLSPLLSKANFFQPPFHLKTEASVQIELVNDDRASVGPSPEPQIVRGRIDVLLLRDEFWVLVVEAKEKGFSLENAIAQALTYMMTSPNTNRPVYGFATNGSEFIFLKTVQIPTPQYALSDLFTLRRQHNDLYTVLQILKAIEKI
jgi:Type I restriction enzyme R protein N terminus (HSDR_N)